MTPQVSDINSAPDQELKSQLIDLSDSIVDLIELMETSDEQTELHKIHRASKELHHLGDHLLEYRKQANGDDLAFILFMLGSVCYSLGYLEKAAEAYSDALKTWPDHVGLLNEYFLALVDLKQYSDAYEIIQKSIKYGGETPDVLQNMATVLVHLNRIAEAKSVLFNCMAKFPNDVESQRFLAELDKNYS
jgi:tetratricopeptide (TPR) repeat protein